MNEIEILRKVLHPSIKISKFCLSYVARIFPDYKDSPCIILHKQRCTDDVNNCSDHINDNRTNDFNVTGSPLKYSFTDVNFEDSIILVKQNWRKEEEKYLPLTRTEACDALNACIDLITDAFPPIFALCDGNDNVRSRLLGKSIQSEWFTTIEVCLADNETFETVKESSSAFLKHHLELSHETNVAVSTSSTFDIFGTREELIDWDKNVKSKFENSISVEVYSSNLSLCSPTRASKNILVAQVVTGSDDSPLQELWTQLLLLNQYLNILEDFKSNTNSPYNPVPLEFPEDFTSPYAEDRNTIVDNINLLLNGDYSYRGTDNVDARKDHFMSEGNLENTVKIKEELRNLPSRYNLDLTDFLWDLLIKNSNYIEMTKCIHSVLNEIVVNECFAQINLTNRTRFAKVITNSSQHTVISNFLSGSLPLEYVVDMGFEKLCRDYVYILINSRFGDLHDIQEKLGNVLDGEFTIDKYRKKLMCLAQIHVCLEFMMLFQDHLICTHDDLRSLFLCAFKQYVCEKSPIQNSHDLDKNIIYTLNATVPVTTINNFNKEIPTTRRISLSSQHKLTKLTTIKYYSEMPIFPTNTCAFGKISFIRNTHSDSILIFGRSKKENNFFTDLQKVIFKFSI
ncbi:protein zwilch homolog isoform X2 [Lasioglossum baleicum]|uniref:protein zwilch homolog isoform X2 n=1 Tax=Lasioglossum baleicum TaxID=434251 RepID=UPI003FCCCB20